MENWKPYIGQGCVITVNLWRLWLQIGDAVIVDGIRQCKCGRWQCTIGVKIPSEYAGQNCEFCKSLLKSEELFWGDTIIIAPIQAVSIKHIIKEVEVAPQIREMEVQLS